MINKLNLIKIIFIIVSCYFVVSIYFLNDRVDTAINGYKLNETLNNQELLTNNKMGINTDKLIINNNVAIKKTKKMPAYNEKNSKKIWDDLVSINFKYPESKVLLLKLLSSGAGWILYDEIINKINDGGLSDLVVADLTRALTYAYEGGNLDKETYHHPKNIKDEKIQIFMREQLINPAGKETLLKVMDLLYFLEAGDNLDLLEDVINTNESILSDKEKLEYRLHYSSNNLERFSEVVNQLNSEENNQSLGYYDTTFFIGLMDHIGEGNNLRNNEAAQTAVRTYLEDNRVHSKFSVEVPDMTNYGNWLKAHAIVSGVDDLDVFFYDEAINTDDPIKTIAIIDYQAGEVDNNSPDQFNKLINNKEIKDNLKYALSNPNTSDVIKKEIKSTLKAYFESPKDKEVINYTELSKAILIMDKNEKEQVRQSLKEVIQSPNSSTEERKSAIKALEELF